MPSVTIPTSLTKTRALPSLSERQSSAPPHNPGALRIFKLHMIDRDDHHCCLRFSIASRRLVSGFWLLHLTGCVAAVQGKSKLVQTYMDEQAYKDTRDQIEELDLKSITDGEQSAPAGASAEDLEHEEFKQHLAEVARMAENIEESDEYKQISHDDTEESRSLKDGIKSFLQGVGVQRCLLSMRRAQKSGAKWAMELTCPIPLSRHKFNVFDFILTVTIAANCVLLAMDRPTLHPDSQTARVILVADTFFLVVFSVECAIKISAMGMVSPGGYMRDSWNLMDATLLALMYVDLLFSAFQGNPGRTLRPLRALRPLRMINKNESMKVVLDLFFHSLPMIANVVVLMLIFFLIMAILGTNLFAGKLYRCNDETVFGQFDCTGTFTCDDLSWEPYYECPGALGEVQVREWTVPINNFDNVLTGFLTLFEVGTLEGWVNVMHNTMDIPQQVGMQPAHDNAPSSSLFFVIFIAVGTFFVMNLVIAVYIDSFNQSRGTGLLTDKQVGWVELKRTMKGIKPRRKRQIPLGSFRRFLYSFVTATEWEDCKGKQKDDNQMVDRELTLKAPLFESAMSFVILVNTAALSMLWVDQSQWWQDTMRKVDWVFVAIYCLEAAAKILGLGHRVYFRGHWNKFDFGIVMFSIMDLVPFIHEHLDTSIVQTTRLLRMVKLVRRVQGLRALVNTLFMSLPAIFNLASLLVIVFYVYAVMGVQLFCGAPFQEFLTEDANFENFSSAMFLLLRVTTGENWNGIMHDIEVSGACDTGQEPPCPQKWAARSYFISFYIIAAFVFMKLFIAVILDNFASSFNQEASAVDPAHLQEYRKRWYVHDREGTGIIRATKLRDFVRSLPKPLGQTHWTRRALEEVCMEVIEQSNAGIDAVDGKLHTREEFIAKYRDGGEAEWGRAKPLADDDWQRVDKVDEKLRTKEQFMAKYRAGGVAEWERGQVFKFHDLLLVLSVRCVGLTALEYRERVHRFHSLERTQKAVAATMIKAAFRGRIARRKKAVHAKSSTERLVPAQQLVAPVPPLLAAVKLPKAEPEPEPEPEVALTGGHGQHSTQPASRPIAPPRPPPPSTGGSIDNRDSNGRNNISYYEVVENPLATVASTPSPSRNGVGNYTPQQSEQDAVLELQSLQIPQHRGQGDGDGGGGGGMITPLSSTASVRPTTSLESPIATREEVLGWGAAPPPGVPPAARVPPGVDVLSPRQRAIVFETEAKGAKPAPAQGMKPAAGVGAGGAAAVSAQALALAEAMAKFASELGMGLAQQPQPQQHEVAQQQQQQQQQQVVRPRPPPRPPRTDDL
jgi:hypothetical protein